MSVSRRATTTLLVGLSALAFAVLSARLDNHYLAYGVVASTLAAILLSAWDKLEPDCLPLLVFLLGLSFLYQATLRTNNLVGTDVQQEYYIYQSIMSSGRWDAAFPHAYNTSVGTTVLAPLLTHWFRIPGYWIFKAVFPFLFALVPAILFQVYRRRFGDKVSFLAAIVFVTLPTYLLEMIGLPRQMLGELMLAIVILLLVLKPLPTRDLIPLMAVAAVLGALFHYLMGPVILAFLLGSLVVLIVIKIMRRWWPSLPTVKFPVAWLSAVIIVSVPLVGFYYAWTAGGTILSNYGLVGQGVVKTLRTGEPVMSGTVPISDLKAPDLKTVSEAENTPPTPTAPRPLSKMEPLVKTALGMDFAAASWTGKTFRAIQLVSELFLMLGCVWIIVNRRCVSAEYVAVAATAVVMLAAAVLIPRFSNVINASRFYHIALFTLAPLMVVGGLYLFRNVKAFSVLFIVPYVLVMTGVMFEATGQTDTSTINAPYSIALSNYRLGVVAEYTDGDQAAADWIADNHIEPVLTDIPGMLLLAHREDPYRYINRSSRTLKYTIVLPIGYTGNVGMGISDLNQGWGYLPQNAGDLPGGAYIFLTSRSIRTKTVTFKPIWYAMVDTASGLRTAYPFAEVGLPGNTDVVFSSGDATVLRVRGKAPDPPRPYYLNRLQHWQMPAQWDVGGHSQGAATDGTYLYWSSGDRLTVTSMDRPDWGNPIAENIHPKEDGTPVDEINGIFLKDGLVYASAPIAYRPPARFFVKWYDAKTLEFVGEKELRWPGEGSMQEGIVFHDGYWWVCYAMDAKISRYDADWNYVDSISLPDVPTASQTQGLAWLDEQLWVSNTATPMRVYDWDADSRKLKLNTSFTPLGEQFHPQSLSFSPDGKYMYWADFSTGYEMLDKFETPRTIGQR